MRIFLLEYPHFYVYNVYVQELFIETVQKQMRL